MEILKKINIDLSAFNNTNVVYAVENDYASRKIEASLFSDGTPWMIPDGCSVSVSYKKTDGTTGWYDKLEDGSNAVSYSGNVVTVSLAAQSLTVAGDVFVSIVFNEASTLKQLASFPFVVKVSDFPSGSGQISNNFYKYDTIGELNDALVSLEKNVSKMKEAFYIHVTKNDGVYYASETYDKISEAINWYYTRKERPVFCVLWDNSPSDFIVLPLTAFDIYEGDVIFTKIQYNYEVVVTIKKESVECGKVYIPYKDDIPERLPNPYPLTINGRKYDGSKEVTILDAPLIVNVGGGDNGYNADVSIDKIDAARRAGRFIWCRVSKSVILPFVSEYGSDTGIEHGYIFSGVDGSAVWTVTVGTDGVKLNFSLVSFKTDIPTVLPNPHALTINGHTYDGSAAADIVTAALTVTVNPLDEGGYTCDKTMDELKAAHNAGRELYCVWGARLPMVGEYGTTSSNIWGYTFRGIVNGKEHSVNIGTDGISVVYTKLVPDKLPNPYPLTINGQNYDGSYPLTLSIYGGTGEGDEGGSYIPVPAVAEVGQTIMVKSVDETGKPTEWEVTNLSKKPMLLCSYSVPDGESLNSIVVNTCNDGTTLGSAGYRKVGVRLVTKGSSELTNYKDLTIIVNDNHPGSGYGVLKQALYNSRRTWWFTAEAQGGAIALCYGFGADFTTGNAGAWKTGDVIDVDASTISSIKMYNLSDTMEYGTTIEIWGIG